jgi:hypothetical protein
MLISYDSWDFVESVRARSRMIAEFDARDRQIVGTNFCVKSFCETFCEIKGVINHSSRANLAARSVDCQGENLRAMGVMGVMGLMG